MKLKLRRAEWVKQGDTLIKTEYRFTKGDFDILSSVSHCIILPSIGENE